MEFRPDGRKYSRITRKSANLIDLFRRGSTYELQEIVRLIKEKKMEEFYLSHLDQYISQSRIRDYLRFLVQIGILSESDGKFGLVLESKPTTDKHKAQVLADLAGVYLARQLNIPVRDVANSLENEAAKILKKGNLATLDLIAANSGISSNKEEEVFRWAIFLFLDGPEATLFLRHSPVLMRKNH